MMKLIKAKIMNKNIHVVLHLTAVFIFFACNEDKIETPVPSTQAKFIVEIENNGIAPAKVYFINRSVNTTSYLWKFGTGDSLFTNSTDTLIYIYEESGSYIASLTVESPNPELYYNSLVVEKVININSLPVKRLYFTDRIEDKVKYVVLDNSVLPIIEEFESATLNKPYGMDMDTTTGKLYVTDYGEQVLNRFNWNGSNQEILMNSGSENFGSPLGIVIVDSKIYWGEPGGIHRANLNGSEPEVYIPIPDEYPQDITYDHITKTFYFTNDLDPESGGIWKVNLNGSNLTQIIPDVWGGAIEIDPVNNRLYYYVGYEGMHISDINGNNPVLFDSSNAGKWAWGMAIDAEAGKIYYPNRVEMTIMRANLDGTNVEVFIPSSANIDPNAMTIDTHR